MSHEELSAALETLHRELTDAEHLDQDDVDQLQQTLHEIQTILDQKSGSADNLVTRVSDSARRFEETHPVLTNTLGRVADILQQMGI